MPDAVASLTQTPSLGTDVFLEDDNRGAVSPEPVADLDGLPFYLSVKGVGSALDPFSHRPLAPEAATFLAKDPEARRRLETSTDGDGRMITGELWLRGSPYGGQGFEHAMTALRISEMADLTSLRGFRIAPVLKVCSLPEDVESRVREIYWYRKFRGPIVQELRLVPSNVRIYFHARNTLASHVGFLFDRFGIDSNSRALSFETRFVRSAVAMLTLFARTLSRDPDRDRYMGLDFHDVWLDKDAVLAPDGTVFFVDLEGIDRVVVERDAVKEKIEDQVYRSLYEFAFAYEQIEAERQRRFGLAGDRKAHFESIVSEALRDDPYAGPVRESPGTVLRIRNACAEEPLNTDFPLVDR